MGRRPVRRAQRRRAAADDGIANETVSEAERLEHLLHPWTSFVVVPIFALANAGVALTADGARRRRTPARWRSGWSSAWWSGSRSASPVPRRWPCGCGSPGSPTGVTLAPHLSGSATLAGIGFTVSLFITGLAFDRPDLQDAARLAVLVTSVVAAGLGSAILLVRRRGPRPATD